MKSGSHARSGAFALAALSLLLSPGPALAQKPPVAGGHIRPSASTTTPVQVPAQRVARWNGYIQARYSGTTAADSGFSIRRAKLWLTGKVGKSFAYKVQARFNNALSGAFMLQDAWIGYHGGSMLLQAGQMVPAFSLERSQPDYAISVVERAEVVNALVPGAETSARDVGLQLGAPLAAGHLHAWAGLFDGAGANEVRTTTARYLLTQRTTAGASLGAGVEGEVGYSLALRQAKGLEFKRIFGDTTRFTGTDFRWGLDASLVGARWQLQGEYIQARLSDVGAAWGYYALGTYDVTPEDQIVAQVDRYQNVSSSPERRPWFGAGWNHLFAGNSIKLMTFARTRFDRGKTDFDGVVQFQLMFR